MKTYNKTKINSKIKNKYINNKLLLVIYNTYE